MKQVKIEKLTLHNFKGIKDFEVEFEDKETTICGDNGIGKSTLNDAFRWLLFGKNSEDRADFSIKPNDEEGNVLHKEEYSVEGVLALIENEATTHVVLKRVYKEKWGKKAGINEEILTGHTTEYYIDGVPTGTKKEYDEFVAGIMPEELFKLLTKTGYFFSLDIDKQRDILFSLVDMVTDEDVAQKDEKYKELLEMLEGKDIQSFINKIVAKKKRINEELKVIPAKIDTAKSLAPEIDWVINEKEIESKQAELSAINKQMADRSEKNKALTAKRIEKQNEIAKLNRQLNERYSEIEGVALKGFYDVQNKITELNSVIANLERSKDNKVEFINSNKSRCEALTKQLDTLRDECFKVNAEKLTIDEKEFICPTCKQPLPVDDVLAKRDELIANFNANKAGKLTAMQEEGKSKKAELEKIIASTKSLEEEIKKIDDAIKTSKEEVEKLTKEQPQKPDCTAIKNSDTKVKEILAEIKRLEGELNKKEELADNNDLIQKAKEIQDDLAKYSQAKEKNEQHKKCIEEVERLECEKELLNRQKTNLELDEDLANSFIRERDEMLADRINSLFTVPKFSFTKDRINGSDKVTCECRIKGTLYPDANSAAKVNAGIEVINVLSKKYRINAPIFIDNRESVNEIIDTDSQVINLKVTTDKSLTISKTEK